MLGIVPRAHLDLDHRRTGRKQIKDGGRSGRGRGAESRGGWRKRRKRSRRKRKRSRKQRRMEEEAEEEEEAKEEEGEEAEEDGGRGASLSFKNQFSNEASLSLVCFPKSEKIQ